MKPGKVSLPSHPNTSSLKQMAFSHDLGLIRRYLVMSGFSNLLWWTVNESLLASKIYKEMWILVNKLLYCFSYIKIMLIKSLMWFETDYNTLILGTYFRSGGRGQEAESLSLVSASNIYVTIFQYDKYIWSSRWPSKDLSAVRSLVCQFVLVA